MKILYIFAHPRPDSFNMHLFKMATQYLNKLGHQVELSNLYAIEFNAIASWQDFELDQQTLPSNYFSAQAEAYQQHKLVPDIEQAIIQLKNADHVIFQFPFWWFSVPAILKGWFDRVLIKGFAYDANKTFERGLLRGKTASLITSTQSGMETYQENGLHGVTMNQLLLPIHHTLRFVGIETLEPLIIYNAFQINDERLQQINNNCKNYLETLLNGK